MTCTSLVYLFRAGNAWGWILPWWDGLLSAVHGSIYLVLLLDGFLCLAPCCCLVAALTSQEAHTRCHVGAPPCVACGVCLC